MTLCERQAFKKIFQCNVVEAVRIYTQNAVNVKMRMIYSRQETLAPDMVSFPCQGVKGPWVENGRVVLCQISTQFLLPSQPEPEAEFYTSSSSSYNFAAHWFLSLEERVSFNIHFPYLICCPDTLTRSQIHSPLRGLFTTEIHE